MKCECGRTLGSGRPMKMKCTCGREHFVMPNSYTQAGTKPTLPGSELAKLLSWFGLKRGSGCSCKEYANMMDYKGADWCEENIDRIVGWMMESAPRSLPEKLSRMAAKKLAMKAIENSRKSSGNNA